MSVERQLRAGRQTAGMAGVQVDLRRRTTSCGGCRAASSVAPAGTLTTRQTLQHLTRWFDAIEFRCSRSRVEAAAMERTAGASFYFDVHESHVQGPAVPSAYQGTKPPSTHFELDLV